MAPMSSDLSAARRADPMASRVAPWAFLGIIWVAWSSDLVLAFLHDDCVGCVQLRIILVLLVIPVAWLSVAILRGWFAREIPVSVYLVGGALLALLLLGLLGLSD